MDRIPKTPLHWDWETLELFNERYYEDSKHLDLKVEGGLNISNCSDCSSGEGACSYVELGNGSLRGSVSTFVDCLAYSESRVPERKIDSTEKIPRNLQKDSMSKLEDKSSVTVSANGPKEPVIGLKLGKRTYFEDSSSGSNMKASSSVTSVPTSASSAKKTKASHQNIQIYCQVEGCKTDLSAAKEYHRKHRVCGIHSRSPKVIVAGQERRFCQQCSRFHDLSAFDQKKKSCRRRLSDHNARRRKPQPETISFNSSLLSAPCYDDKHQMNLAFGRPPICYINTAANAAWNNITGDFELRQFRGTKLGGITGERQFLPALPNNATSIHCTSDGLLPYMRTTSEFLNHGLEPPIGVSSLQGVQDARHALSLLSTDSFGSANFGQASTVQFTDANIPCFTHPGIQTVGTSSGFWQDQQHVGKELTCDPHGDSVQLQDFQLHKTTHEAYFFDSKSDTLNDSY